MSTQTYGFRCEVDDRFSFSPAAKAQTLVTNYFSPEIIGKEQEQSADSSYSTRQKLFEHNKIIPFMSDLHIGKKTVFIFCLPFFIISFVSEFMNTQKLLMPGLQIRIKLIPNHDEFAIVSQANKTETYRVEIQKIKLTFRLVSCQASVLPSILERLEKGQVARYPFTQTQIRVDPVTSGKSFHNFEFLFSGPLPSQVSL